MKTIILLLLIILLIVPQELLNNDKLTAKLADLETRLGAMESAKQVSPNFFLSGQTSHSGTQTTTSATFVDITGMSLSFTLVRPANVYFFGTLSGRNQDLATASVSMESILSLDGSQVGGSILTPGAYSPFGGGGVYYETGTMMWTQSVTAGAHTLKLQFRQSGGGTAGISASTKTMGYLVLGN